MKVLIVSQTYCEWNSRAKWRELVEIYPGTIVKVITPRYWPDVLSRVESRQENIKNKFSVIPSKAFLLGQEIYHFYPKLSATIKNFKPDLIQVETGSNSFTLFQTLLTKKLCKLKTKVLFFSWVNWVPKFGWKYRFFYEWVERFNLRNVDGAILGNSLAKEILISHKRFNKKSVVIPQLGTDSTVFSFAQDRMTFREKLGISKAKFVIGFAGRLVLEKGVGILIKAFYLMKKQLEPALFEKCHLVIAGCGPYQKQLEREALENNLEKEITFLGALAHQQMPIFFKALDIFVLPSFDSEDWKEQFGQVIVQAMMSKVPVVGSDGGEIANVIGNAGLVFKQKDSSDLAVKLKMLISDEKLRSDLSQKGYERASQYYSHGAIARQTYEFCKSLEISQS